MSGVDELARRRAARATRASDAREKSALQAAADLVRAHLPDVEIAVVMIRPAPGAGMAVSLAMSPEDPAALAIAPSLLRMAADELTRGPGES